MWDIIIVIDFVMFLAIMGGYEQDMFGFGGCVFRLLIFGGLMYAECKISEKI